MLPKASEQSSSSNRPPPQSSVGKGKLPDRPPPAARSVQSKADSNGPPPGFPSSLKGPMTWDGGNFEKYRDDPSSYTVALDDDDDLKSIDAAVTGYTGTASALNSGSFPVIQALQNKLASISDTLYNGRGFLVLRGLDPKRFKYNDQQNLIIFVGLSSYVGSQRGWKLNHIYDLTGRKEPFNILPSNLPISMSFHTDVGGGDVIALYVQDTSRDGGDTNLASFWNIYNKLAPDVLALLATNWPWEDPEGGPNGEPQVVNKPIIYSTFNSDGTATKISGADKVQIRFARTFLSGSPYRPRAATSPALTANQELALANLAATAQLSFIKIKQQPGDLIFFNNLSMLHARDAFVNGFKSDADGVNSTLHMRHLLRLSLRDPANAWKIPDAYATEFTNKYNKSADDQLLLTLAQADAIGDDGSGDHD